MVCINKGYMHLLNNLTSTLTTSDRQLDFMRCGGFLSKNIEKMYKNHDRCPGKIADDSPIKELLEDYQVNKATLKEVSVEIADILFKKRDSKAMDTITSLFVLEGGDEEGDKLFVMELSRTEKYQIALTSTDIQVIANDLILNNAALKKTNFFTVNLSNLDISFHGPKKDVFRDAFELELEPSLNMQLKKSRDCLYNTITKIEGRETKIYDIQISGNEEKINLVNVFEGKLHEGVATKRLIDFEEIASELFEESRMLREEFIDRLKSKRVPLMLKALSDAAIDKKQVKHVTSKKIVKLKNGIEITIPEGVEEIKPIILENKDGVIQEVENNEEV